MRLTVCILLFFIYACVQTNGASTTGKTIHAENPDNSSIEGEALSERAQLESPDRYVDTVLSQQFNKIKSACDENKTLDQRIADIREAIVELSDLIEQYYEHQRHQLSIHNRIRLAEINDVLFTAHVFRSSPTKELVLSTNFYDSFVSYYGFMFNSEIEKVEDFYQQWARDFARGLGCLYTAHPD